MSVSSEAPVAGWRAVAPWLSWWAVMASSFGAALWLAGGEPIDATTSYAVCIGNMLLVAGLEQALPRLPAANLLRDRQSWRDLSHLLLFTFAGKPLAWPLSLALVAVVADHTTGLAGAWPAHLPTWVQLSLLLLTFDLLSYAYHRTLHRFDRTFWFHAIHHDTPQLHMLKAVRLHFVEQFVNFLIVVSPFVLLGCPSPLFIWLGTWNVFEGNLAHSNLAQRFPWWMHYLVRTVDVHHIHHSERAELQHRNFGGLPIWDLLFGTYRHPSSCVVTTTGLRGSPVPRTLRGQLLFPFRALLHPPACEDFAVAAPLPAGDGAAGRGR